VSGTSATDSPPGNGASTSLPREGMSSPGLPSQTPPDQSPTGPSILLRTDPGPEQPACYDGESLGCMGETESTGFSQVEGEPFLDVVSVYETHGMHGFSCSPQGVFRVKISRPGTHVLVLSSYEPAHWRVDAALGAKVLRVLITGYNHATWTVPAGATTDDLTWPTTGQDPPIAYTFPSDDADTLVTFAESRTGLLLSTLWMAYCNNSATIL
jgi:hypothetical protein